ncbi:MAG: cytochrome C, partial [Bacteroidetes bacterium]|nr:cytochrome C [Bacteroidota bacterium]
MAEQDSLKTQRLIIGVFSILLVVVLIIVAGVEMKQTQSTKLQAVISGDNKRCIDCHTSKGVAVKAIDAWKESVHAQQNIGCLDCHKANKNDFDAFYCPESDLLVARHPTPKDCAECHEQEVKEFADSKHAHQFWLIKNADRSVFEPTIATRNGCEQCHQIGNVWPDKSVGECDACHPKHTS